MGRGRDASKRKPRRPSTRRDYPCGMSEYHAMRTAVLAARDELERADVYPTAMRVAKAAGVRGVDVGAISDILRDGAFVEHPDDPDAAEIQARIAEVRAEKEADPPPRRPLEVATGRFHHPALRMGSRQRIVA